MVTVAAESLLAEQRLLLLLMSVSLALHQVLASQRDSDAAQGHQATIARANKMFAPTGCI